MKIRELRKICKKETNPMVLCYEEMFVVSTGKDVFERRCYTFNDASNKKQIMSWCERNNVPFISRCPIN